MSDTLRDLARAQDGPPGSWLGWAVLYSGAVLTIATGAAALWIWG